MTVSDLCRKFCVSRFLVTDDEIAPICNFDAIPTHSGFEPDKV